MEGVGALTKQLKGALDSRAIQKRPNGKPGQPARVGRPPSVAKRPAAAVGADREPKKQKGDRPAAHTRAIMSVFSWVAVAVASGFGACCKLGKFAWASV